jgi:hypothetical protein
MPDLPVKDARLPALHLPEFKRDDIVRSLSEIRLPEADRSKVQRRRIELPDAVAKFEWPRLDLSSLDVPKALAGAAAAVNIGRRSRRPRWPLAIGGVIVVGTVAAVLFNEGVRTRLANAINTLRERLMGMRPTQDDVLEIDVLEIDVDDPIAFDAAETAAIEPSPFAETTAFEATGYPDGLGVRNGDATFEESGKPS